ncbi:MAG: hypothetical protein J6S85_07670 [Methanobrevibacter sp.]|nr:hypothetical protein [Methanobrevibacter sp.]
MEHSKIKYVFRADGPLGKQHVEGLVKSYEENPNGHYGAYGDKVNIEITDFMANGISFHYKNSYGRISDLCMQYYDYTAIIMEEGIVFYNVGSANENHKKLQKEFVDYCEEGILPEWANDNTDYIELDDIVL